MKRRRKGAAVSTATLFAAADLGAEASTEMGLTAPAGAFIASFQDTSTMPHPVVPSRRHFCWDTAMFPALCNLERSGNRRGRKPYTRTLSKALVPLQLTGKKKATSVPSAETAVSSASDGPRGIVRWPRPLLSRRRVGVVVV